MLIGLFLLRSEQGLVANELVSTEDRGVRSTTVRVCSGKTDGRANQSCSGNEQSDRQSGEDFADHGEIPLRKGTTKPNGQVVAQGVE